MIAPPLRPEPASSLKRARLPAVGAVLGAAVAVFGAVWAADLFLAGAEPAAQGGSSWELLLSFDAQAVEEAVAGLSQVIVAVLGIAITVVSIVLQLSATRYTPRVADMFFRDPKNLAMLGFFVVACLDAVWVSVAVGSRFVPRGTIALTVALVTGSLLLLVPYFAYVFDFLDPERVIQRLADQVLDAALGRRAQARGDVAGRQAAAASGLEHLGAVAVNAAAQKDKVIAAGAIGAVRRLVVEYLPVKRRAPESWFVVTGPLHDDPDFTALAAESLAEIERDGTWLEWKAMRHLRTAFAEALAHLPDLAHVVAIDTRLVGQAALGLGARPVLGLVLKFFNTFLRTALNTRDVRASYNVFNEYRQLAERALEAGQDELVLEIGRHFKYYGQTAHAAGLGFVLETAAYDLSLLCERAFDGRAACHDRLLATFLEVDKEPETTAEERALRGVRKAQVKLATHYLVQGAEGAARAIFEDLRQESPARLASIRQELAGITTRDFWEVTDRGVNFDYLDPRRKAALDRFFGWFPGAA
jgi:hypothetical protein